MLWITRAAALLCAAGTGWAFSRQTPDWRGDAAMDSREYNEFLGARSYGGASSGCAGLHPSCLLGWLRGSVQGSLCLVATVALAFYAWPLEHGMTDWNQVGGPRGFIFLMLFSPALWWPLLAGIAGFIAGTIQAEQSRPNGRR